MTYTDALRKLSIALGDDAEEVLAAIARTATSLARLTAFADVQRALDDLRAGLALDDLRAGRDRT